MTKWEGMNRRRFPRVKFPCLVILENDLEQKEPLLTHTENIGVGGVCLVINRDIPVFTDIGVELDLLDLEDHVKCVGKVVWNVQRNPNTEQRPLFYDLGIEFQDIDEGVRARINEVVERLAKEGLEVPHT